MVLNCCVPLCKSKSTDRGPTGKEKLSFHQFPCNLDLRDVWIKNVGRKDWLPGDTTSLCSKHFAADQFKVGMKKVCLLPTAVPTILEGRKVQTPRKRPRASKKKKTICRKTEKTTKDVVPKSGSKITRASKNDKNTELLEISKQPGDALNNGNKCNSSEISSQKEEKTKISNIGKKRKLLESSSEMGKSEPTNKNNVELLVISKERKEINGQNQKNVEIPNKPGDTCKLLVTSNNKDGATKKGQKYKLLEIPCKTAKNGKKYRLMEIPSKTENVAENAKRPKLQGISSEAEVDTKKAVPYPNALPSDHEQHLATERHLKAQQKKIYRQKAKIASQKIEIATLKESLQTISALPLLAKVRDIAQAASEGKLNAMYLYSQIKSFGAQSISWDKKLIEYFKHWRAVSQKGYDFPRQCGVLRLPHPTTLGRCQDSGEGAPQVPSFILDLTQGFNVISEVEVVSLPLAECEDAIESIPSDIATT